MTLYNRRDLLTASLSAAAASIAAEARGQHSLSLLTGPSPDTYVKDPFILHMAISPDGLRTAAISKKGNGWTLIVTLMSEGKNTVINLPYLKIAGLFWASNDHVLVVSSSTQKRKSLRQKRYEALKGHLINTQNGQMRTLFVENGLFDVFIHGNLQRLKIGDKYFLAASTFFSERDNNLCLFRFDTDFANDLQPKQKIISIGNADTDDFLIRPDGYVLAQSTYDAHSHEWALHFNTARPESAPDYKVVVRRKTQIDTPVLLGLGRSDDSVIIWDKTEGGATYFEVTPDAKLIPLERGPNAGSDSAPLFHPTTGRFNGYLRDGDWHVYDYVDPLLKKLSEAVAEKLEENYRFTLVDFAEDPRKMIVYCERFDDAGSYYVMDFITGEAKLAGHTYPTLPSSDLSDKKPFNYEASDGLSIHAYLTLPLRKTAQNLPLIVLPHGGPEARDDIGFDGQAQAFASLGYAVLQPNYRGSSGYGDAFVAAGYGQMGRKMQTDLSDGVRHLASKGIIDPARVAIIGSSYGGYAALAGAAFDPGIYRCAVSIAGVSDIIDFLKFVEAGTDKVSAEVLYWKRFFGEEEGWDGISPAKQAEKTSCPVLLLHGTDDSIVPFEQSLKMETALKAAGKTVYLTKYVGQDHWESFEAGRIDMLGRIRIFLNKYNPV